MLDPTAVTPHFLEKQVAKNFHRLQSFQGRARVIIEFPGDGYSGFSQVYLNAPDSLLVKTEATLGIDIGVLFMDHRLFGAYAPRENTFYYGEIESLDLADFLQVELETEELYELFAGLGQMDLDTSSKVAVDDNAYLLTTQTDAGLQKYWIDPEHFVVTRAVLLDADGQTSMIKEFKRLRRKDGLTLPQTVRITRPLARERVTVYYTRQEVNEAIPPERFKLKIPENAKKIYWGDLKRPRIERKSLQNPNPRPN